MINRFIITFFITLNVYFLGAQGILQNQNISALRWRGIGPAIASGRISDFAFNPNNNSEYYVAVASGGVWKTTNKGTTFSPIFDGEGSYSIGCITVDNMNTSVVWVGTGENNNQRSVAYGDGIYKSDDAGKTWKNMGLKNSEHIAEIAIDPTNSNTVYVAAYGPLWKEGGERGVFKSTDGGVTWKNIKTVSQYTGCNDIVIDPKNPRIIYAAFHQRMRKVYTYIGGGPESALFKSTDGGETWSKLTGGLPSGDLGRLGLAMSPLNSAYLYTVVEAKDDKGGIYRSTDAGNSWNKMSGFFTSGNYYQEIYCDPHDINKIYISDTYFKVSYDGGKTVSNLGEINKHIDNHAIWIDPKDPKHLLVGCDGGIYETYDHAKTWDFKSNLSVTQFYKVSTDNAYPFYNVHGGTQDNCSFGGPSRTFAINGILNSDWYVSSTGDGFESQVDPTDPNIIYAQSQYGGLNRYDHSSGEYLPIKPIESMQDDAYRWNWDSPLLISQHNHKRLYFGSNRLFRTDDQGNSWTTISPDLSRQVDRNKFEVMNKVWSVDAVAKNQSTDIFGQTTSIAESKFDENFLWVGTDDGLIQLTKDGGKTWKKIDQISGVPDQSYVHQIIASLHDKNTAYVCFNHHRYGDFKPYLLKTNDGGNTWKSIVGNLPQRGSVYSIAEDHIDPNLLFAGTEFGCFFTHDGGLNWQQLKSGLPTIAVRDIDIQRRENDLVIASFGRGFYILDDYSSLRNFKKEYLDKPAKIFPVKDALMYIERTPLGLRDKGHLGSNLFTAPNPEYGACFTYYIKDELKTLKEIRKELEKQKLDKNEKIEYPSLDALRLEDQQIDPYYFLTIKDESGQVIRHIKLDAKKGFNRVNWDLRSNLKSPINSRRKPNPDELFGEFEVGHLVMPGMYAAQISKFQDGVISLISDKVNFNCKLLTQGKNQTKDMAENVRFYKQIAESSRELGVLNNLFLNTQNEIKMARNVVLDIPGSSKEIIEQLSQLNKKENVLLLKLFGDGTRRSREFETEPSLNDRLGNIEYGVWNNTCEIPKMYKDSYAIATKQLEEVKKLMQELRNDMDRIHSSLEKAKAPYSPGRKLQN
ncbi:MAG: glycosyl hydrolase [Saprospiraceae bacterium]|nr:glycosyl hydrolase [Saprospiraceae bacterium]